MWGILAVPKSLTRGTWLSIMPLLLLLEFATLLVVVSGIYRMGYYKLKVIRLAITKNSFLLEFVSFPEEKLTRLTLFYHIDFTC